MEQWAHIEGYDSYAVSNLGRVCNVRRDEILSPSINRQGIAKVGLFDRSTRTTTSRSIATLVAAAFLEEDDRPEFDTPIQLDGDRTNCNVENLMWRPRWFAVRYHNQFYNERFRFERYSFFEIGTEEVFEDYIKPCTTYGLFWRNVALSFLNDGRDSVFPTWQRFRLLDN